MLLYKRCGCISVLLVLGAWCEQRGILRQRVDQLHEMWEGSLGFMATWARLSHKLLPAAMSTDSIRLRAQRPEVHQCRCGRSRVAHRRRCCKLPHDKPLGDGLRGNRSASPGPDKASTPLLLQRLHRRWRWSPDQRDRAACSWRRWFVRPVGYRRRDVQRGRQASARSTPKRCLLQPPRAATTALRGAGARSNCRSEAGGRASGG